MITEADKRAGRRIYTAISNALGLPPDEHLTKGMTMVIAGMIADELKPQRVAAREVLRLLKAWRDGVDRDDTWTASNAAIIQAGKVGL